MKPLKKIIQHKAYQVVLWQLVGVLVLSLIIFLCQGKKSGVSVLLGGLAYGLANLFFVWRVFRYSAAHEMVQFMSAFLFGEFFKLGFSAILVLMIVKYLSVSLLSVLVGFVGAIISFWIACMWQFSAQNTTAK